MLELPKKILSLCRGVVACALLLPQYRLSFIFKQWKLIYWLYRRRYIFCILKVNLDEINCQNIKQIKDDSLQFLILHFNEILIAMMKMSEENLILDLKFSQNEEKLLEFKL